MTSSHSTCTRVCIGFSIVRLLVDHCSYVFGPGKSTQTWPVSSGYEMKCFCYMNSTIIYYIHERDFESPWLWDVNRGSLRTGSRRGRKKHLASEASRRARDWRIRKARRSGRGAWACREPVLKLWPWRRTHPHNLWLLLILVMQN